MSKPLIIVATPCFGEVVGQQYTMSLMQLLCNTGGRFDMDVLMIGGDSLISRVRSLLVARFLEIRNATHLLFIDADISFESAQVTRLLDFDKDFSACFYPLKRVHWQSVPARIMRGEPLEAAGLSYVGQTCAPPDLRIDSDFATANYAGTGFQLIKRSVFERMIEAYPQLKFRSVDTLSNATADSDNLYALFECMIEPETGAYLSEDYSFCRRWRSIGGEIWLDLKSRITHHGTQAFKGDYSVRAQALSSALTQASSFAGS